MIKTNIAIFIQNLLPSLLLWLLPMGLSWPIPPEIPELEYLGMFPRLLSPACPKLPMPPPIPLPYL